MENDVFICAWKRTAAGFKLWVRSQPQLSVEGDDDVFVLSEQLSQRIAEADGAQHAVLEFDTPLPKSEFDARYSDPEIFSLCGDERFEVACPDQNDRAWFDAFFMRPHCRECDHQSSARNERPLTVSYLRPAFDGGFISCCGGSLTVFSDAFLELLTPPERANLQLVPLLYARPSRKKYYELVGPTGLPFCAVSTLKISGWRCDACGYRTFGYWSAQSSIHAFTAKSQLRDPLPTVFTLGSPPDIHLCITASRWHAIVGQSGTRGLVTSQIGVAPDADVVVSPELSTRRELAREQARLRREKRN